MIETILLPPNVKKISLPNQKRGKRINLHKLLVNLENNSSFCAKMDSDANPKQNWVELSIVGRAKIFSNGTATTTLNLPNEALIIFFEKLYRAYIEECLE
jgi:hypothetical protein